jgi:hypothetical protein
MRGELNHCAMKALRDNLVLVCVGLLAFMVLPVSIHEHWLCWGAWCLWFMLCFCYPYLAGYPRCPA